MRLYFHILYWSLHLYPDIIFYIQLSNTSRGDFYDIETYGYHKKIWG